jgi:hypothetical protein
MDMFRKLAPNGHAVFVRNLQVFDRIGSMKSSRVERPVECRYRAIMSKRTDELKVVIAPATSKRWDLLSDHSR